MNWGLDGRPRLCFLSWDDDEPAVALSDKVMLDVKLTEVFGSDRDKGEEREDQAIPIKQCVRPAHVSSQWWLTFVHELLPQCQELDTGNDGPGSSLCGRCRAKPC